MKFNLFIIYYSGNEKHTIILKEIEDMTEIAKQINEKAIRVKYRLAKAILLTKTKSNKLEEQQVELQQEYNDLTSDIERNQQDINALIQEFTLNDSEYNNNNDYLNEEHKATIKELGDIIKNIITRKNEEIEKKQTENEEAVEQTLLQQSKNAELTNELSMQKENYQKILSEKTN